ncbi:MAG: hypothetical protein KGV44_10165 [Flavobacteriaceae bacterium]|nr:hypothetical protein [Flavobacteriaceae bacterium]
MKKIYLIFIFLLIISPCFSQPNEQGFYGIVVDKNGSAVSDVLISVNWQKRGLLSKADGSFYIMAQLQDTLVFRHTSFEPKAIALQNQTSDTLKIQLTERTLILDEVTVTNWGEWKDFKDKIAEMNADSIRNTDAYRLEMMFGTKKRNPIKNPYFRGQEANKLTPSTIIGGIFSRALPQMIFNKYSKKEQIRRKIEAEKLQELAVAQNGHRYSLKLLEKLLKIKGKQLKSFKKYCDYTLDFNQNDLHLIQDIDSLFKCWKKQKTDTLLKNDSSYLPISTSPFKILQKK